MYFPERACVFSRPTHDHTTSSDCSGTVPLELDFGAKLRRTASCWFLGPPAPKTHQVVMSAKRLKIEGMNGERASRTRARSFASPPPPAVAEEDDDGGGHNDRHGADNLPSSSPAAPSDDDRRRGDWNSRGENLVRIESALSLNRSFRQPGSLLSFDEFYALLGKVPLNADAAATAVTATGVPTATKEGEPAEDRLECLNGALSQEERHLYHLLRIAVPVLYNVCLLSDDEAKQRRHNALLSSITERSTTNETSDGASPPASPKKRKSFGSSTRRCYYLEKVAFPGNRIKELRRLVREFDPLAIVHDDILGAIRKHREASSSSPAPSLSTTRKDPSQPPAAPAGEGSGSGSDPKDVIRAGMSIEERVRARENARLKRNDDVARATADAVEAGETTMDRGWLVRVSDALWRHASDVLATQNRGALQSSRHPKRKVSFCTLTLKDAVSVLRKALTPPGANSHDKKTASQALVDAILELTKIGPKWIQLTGTGGRNGKASKDDTVWLYHSHYHEARALVSGKAIAAKPSNREEELLLSDPAHSPTTKAGDSASKRSLDAPAGVVPRSRVVVTSDDYGATQTLPKKPRHDSQSLDAAAPVRPKHEPVLTPMNEKTPPPASASKKPSLRINPHLILSDADYSTCLDCSPSSNIPFLRPCSKSHFYLMCSSLAAGGEIIVPTNFDSPRGLKVLFDDINAGNRI